MALGLHWQTFAHVLLLLISAAAFLYVVVVTPLHPHDPLENGVFLLCLAWVLAAAIFFLSQLEVLRIRQHVLVMWSIHVVNAGVTVFLLLCAGLLSSRFAKCSGLTTILGTAILLYCLWTGEAPGMLDMGWRVLMVLGTVVVLAGLAMKLKLDTSHKSFLTLVAGVMGGGLLVDALLLSSQGMGGLTAVHFVYFAFVFLLGLMFSERIHWLPLRQLSTPGGHASHHFSPMSGLLSTNHSQLSEMNSTNEITQVRQRIAQDIHDGVGSQIVGLIASLDPHSALHRRVLMGLESCLIDLKMAVDSIDNHDTNIFDALGRLRYRLQPSLDRAGIKMLWKVDFAGPLVSIRSDEVAHLVHIVQECLSNVLQHSQAKKVQLLCRYEAEPEPRLRLEVQDNGIGIDRRKAPELMGKGLTGMQARAKQLGVSLHIGTQAGMGTRVRIYLPLRSANATAQA
jgi:signal transduction histidine kinase